MANQEMTPEQVYQHNKKKAKILRLMAPIVFWSFLALSIICLIFAIKNSFGNVAEIITMLDGKTHNSEQLQENYNYLLNKYGEWTIGNGSKGFQVKFINIGNALFSGLMIINITLSVIFFIGAHLLGKWILPRLSAQILTDNQDYVNMTMLKSIKDKEEKEE